MSLARTGADHVAPPSVERTTRYWLRKLPSFTACPFSNATKTVPSGATTGAANWSSRQRPSYGSGVLENVHTGRAAPLISRGADQVSPPSRDTEKKIGDSRYWNALVKWNRVQVM